MLEMRAETRMFLHVKCSLLSNFNQICKMWT
jgi:hypothetical protein